MKTRLLIDCDPGHDDAMAILFAARHADLVGITTVFGNASLADTTRNALGICALGRLDVPVAAGFAGPLIGRADHAADIHGSTGLDGAELPAPRQEPVAQHAVPFIIAQARAAPGQLVLAPIGPLTNIAVALKTEPRLAGWLAGISLMGGSTTIGNITSHAEFNVHCDPEAAAIVFGSGVPIRMVGLDVTRQAGIGPAHVERLRRSPGPVADVFAGLLAHYVRRSREVYDLPAASMHDPCAILPLVAPGLVTYRDAHVHVELASPQLRGMTACDLRKVNPGPLETVRRPLPPNAAVAIAIDGPAAVDRVIDALLAYDA